MEILFEDNDIIVCVKEPGVQSEKSAGKNMPAMIAEHTGKDPFTVHRLDKDTGGIMVYALSSSTAAELSRQVRDGCLAKRYYAVLKGVPEQKSGVLTDLLYHDRQKNKTFVVKRERNGVKKAELEYEIIREWAGTSLADISLLTGRTHQIRVQFAFRGHPLEGDGKYGGGSGGYKLFAYFLEFNHPKTGEKISFSKIPGWATET